MLALADMVNFFANELAGLRARGLAFAFIFARASQCFLFRHAAPPLFLKQAMCPDEVQEFSPAKTDLRSIA